MVFNYPPANYQQPMRSPGVVPFTMQDGATFWEVLRALHSYLDSLIATINDEYAKWTEDQKATLEAIRAEMAKTIEEFEAKVTEQLAAQDDKVDKLLTAKGAEFDTKAQDLTDYVNTEVDKILNASIETKDDLVNIILKDVSSKTRATLDQIILSAIGKNDRFVRTVNGKDGRDVVITAGDVGAVSSVNGKTGLDVTLDNVDVGAERLSTFNVMDFGAIGNGIADDTPAVAAAVTAGEGKGSVILFPPGYTYNMPGYVKLNSDTHIRGYGATLVKPVGAQRVIDSFFGILSEGRKGYGSGAVNISIQGFTVIGRAHLSEPSCLLAAHHGSNIVIRDVVGIMCMGRGHFADLAGCDNVLVENCQFYGAQDRAGDTAGETIQPDISASSTVSIAEADGTWYDGLPAKNIKVNGCVFEQHVIGVTTYPAPIPFGTHTSPGLDKYYYGLWFTNNVVGITQAKVGGVMGAVHIISSRHVTISGNRFDGGEVDNQLVSIQGGFGTGVENTSNGVVISNNHFFMGRANHIRLSGPITNISIMGNTFKNFGRGASDVSNGINVGTGPDLVTIVGNSFESAGTGASSTAGAIFATAGSPKQITTCGNVSAGISGGFTGAGFQSGATRTVNAANSWRS